MLFIRPLRLGYFQAPSTRGGERGAAVALNTFRAISFIIAMTNRVFAVLKPAADTLRNAKMAARIDDRISELAHGTPRRRFINSGDYASGVMIQWRCRKPAEI